MTAIPQGVARETLLEILAGWHEVGASSEPVHTNEVADATCYTDATSRQTPFLEAIGLLEAVGQKHRLTERGSGLAAALVEGDDQTAQHRAFTLLSSWPPTEDIRSLLQGAPRDEDTLLRLLAEQLDADLDTGRDRTGCRTLLDLLVWADVLDRTDDGSYLPGRIATDGGESGRSAIEVGLTLSIDVDPDEIEALVRAVRRGLDGEETTLQASLDDIRVTD